jgi:hypothetical protein
LDGLLIAHEDRDDHGVVQPLEALASLAAAEADHQRALMLSAAATDIREQLGLLISAWDRHWLDTGAGAGSSRARRLAADSRSGDAVGGDCPVRARDSQ